MTAVSRRAVLQSAGCGFGWLAFSGMCQAATAPGAHLHHEPAAKRVLFLFMHGGPSHVDTFDHKPRLQKEDGKNLPFSAAKNLDAKSLKLLKSPWRFSQHGQSGKWVSELFPNVARYVDDLCFIHSLHSRGQSHGQAVSMLHTGTDSLVRPSVGAWVSYGLGTENNNLPAFLSITPPRGHGGPRNYGSAFLPAEHQATVIGHSGQQVRDAKIPNLQPAQNLAGGQRRQIELLQRFNRRHKQAGGDKSQIEGVIRSFELAYRMQQAAPKLMDLSGEPEYIQRLYGIGTPATDNFGRQCLMARRFSEAGVRYVQVSTGQVWDQHSNLKVGHERNSLSVDLPIAGLLTDLKQRGLWDDTLVVWSGEFGRTPIVQGKNGRDHNPQGYSVWLGGGAVKSGFSYGSTDEYGYYAVRDKVHIHDLHATILHILGIDHTRLTYRYAGRDFRLTDVYGEVVRDILA